MKELKIHTENVPATYGRKKNPTRIPGQLPLSDKTNKKGKISSLRAENEDDVNFRKTSKKAGFQVFEDEASPARTVSVSDGQTQTEPPGPPASDADRLVADLIAAEEPSGQYWRQLAETRQRALEEALEENQQLHDRLAAAEEETRLLRDVVQQAEGVMAAVQEWSEEQEQEASGRLNSSAD